MENIYTMGKEIEEKKSRILSMNQDAWQEKPNHQKRKKMTRSLIFNFIRPRTACCDVCC
ncbi:hypothetical protein [Sediminibacillus massiliensis]|uniref:hypothetical protein n=1 Tax=Sediminibacillus massiliensis TaxID=1926277 RepID=UPI0015C36E63|nr:hypothetical protein [Sediminibacillus massiliensis]